MMRSLGWKFLMMGVLVFMLGAPLIAIHGLVGVRQETRDAAVQEIARGTGRAQTIVGPMLVVPVLRTVQDREIVENRYVLPDMLAADARLSTETRHRGIYEARLFRGATTLKARFTLPARSGAGERHGRPWLAIGVSDVRGIGRGVSVQAGGQALQVEAGTGTTLLASGIQVLLTDAAIPAGSTSLEVVVDIPLQGTSAFLIAPVGRESTLSIASDWPHPSFSGDLLPVSRNITAQGFEARWQAGFLATEMPGRLLACERKPDCRGIDAPVSGVSFIDPVDQYLRTDRAIKYGLLFIALTFAGFFLCEVLLKRNLHPVQYGLVGLSLAFFFLLLLSLSEHLGFGIAYLASAVASVGLLGAYVGSVLAGRRAGMMFATCLAALYGLLYVLLGSEDYALLMGSGLLFAMLALFMLITRRIDWGKV
jgi:inner membrane protein